MTSAAAPHRVDAPGTSCRIALLSDIHGNSLALDAVLRDIQEAGGVDSLWLLGDIVALGHDPVGVLERLAQLPGVRWLRGNTERYLLTGERPPPTDAQVAQDASLLPTLRELERSFGWTLGALAATGWLTWLRQLPLDQRLTLPDGTRLLGVHAAPGLDDGPGIHPGLSDAALREVLQGADAELVCVGHTHVPLDRTIDGVRVFNLGSLSNPVTADLRASYGLLESSGAGYQLSLRRVEYDHQAVIAALEAAAHPAIGYLSRFMRGELRSRWACSAS